MPKHLTQLKTADIDISDKTFAMTYSRSFMQRTEQVKRLATHDIDDALEFAEHDQFHVFFPTLFRLPIRFNTFHATSNSISTFSMLKIFCGYQYSSSKPLEYPAKLQQANPMLRHSFMKPVILVGKVFGSKVLDIITNEILADAHYSTHEYVVHRACLTHDMQRSTTSHARSSTTSPPSPACYRRTTASISTTRLLPFSNMPLRRSRTHSGTALSSNTPTRYCNLSLRNHYAARQSVAARTSYSTARWRPAATTTCTGSPGLLHSPSSKLQDCRKLFCDAGEVLLPQPGKTVCVRVAHLVAHRAAAPELFVGDLDILRA